MNLLSARQGKSEKIAVSTSAVGFTKTKYKTNSDGSPSRTGAGQAFVTVEDTIRFTLDGTTPDPSTKVGHVWFAGSPLILEGEQNIINFKCVRESTTTDTTLYVTYF